MGLLPGSTNMSPLAIGIVAMLVLGTGSLAFHYRLHRARHARIRVEADAFGGRPESPE